MKKIILFLTLFSITAINAQTIWNGVNLGFQKCDYDDYTLEENQDRITENVWITRGDDQPIFNIAQEESSNRNNPADVEWFYGTLLNYLDNPTNFCSGELCPKEWREVFNRDPEGFLNKDYVLHLITDDIYIDIKFTGWTQDGNGGGFSYVRSTDPDNPPPPPIVTDYSELTIWNGINLDFQKCNYADYQAEENQDRITDNVWITRGDQRPIFNIAQESSSNGDNPADVEWFYGTTSNFLDNIRNYCAGELYPREWREVFNRNPEGFINQDYVLHLITDDIYIDIKFTSWTQDGNGGGFSYVRSTDPDNPPPPPIVTDYSELTIWNGINLDFQKCNYADYQVEENQDRITDNVWITRGDQRPIFNIAQESSSNGDNPADVEWFYGTTSNFLDNIRNYCAGELYPREWREVFNRNPEGFINQDYVLHLITDDIYIDIKFTSWTENNNGGGFSYVRSTDPDNPPPPPIVTEYNYSDFTIWNGINLDFQKCNYADYTLEENQDRITENVWITRGDNRPIFNIAQEGSSDGENPADVEWFYGTTSNFLDNPTNFCDGKLYSRRWQEVFNRDPRGFINQDYVLHLITDDIYIDIKFTSWTENNNGGGFSYVRSTDPDNPPSPPVPSDLNYSDFTIWNGANVVFQKNDYADYTLEENQDRITENVWITRGDNRPIFNIAQEESSNRNNPADVEWFYGTTSNFLDNPTNVCGGELYSREWREVFNEDPTGFINQNFVLHLISDDIYLDIKFTSWTENDNGGGFSYVRSSGNNCGQDSSPPIVITKNITLTLDSSGSAVVKNIWEGPSVSFTKNNYADWTLEENQDRITENIWLTRQDGQSIFNIKDESSYTNLGPSGTLWSFGTTEDIESLTFKEFTPATNNNPRSAIDVPMVLYIPAEEIYIDIMFTSFTGGGGGGGFSYVRSSASHVLDGGSTDNCTIYSYRLDVNTFDCSNVGENTVTLTVTDVNGNIGTAIATVVIVDLTDPTVITKNVTVELNSRGEAFITTDDINNGSSDNCSIASMSLDRTTFECSTLGDYTVNLTVVDGSGNSSSATATVTVTGEDIDGDLIVDDCDDDMDGDGVLNESDNCMRTYNPNQRDLDYNGIGDVCDESTLFFPQAFSPNGDGIRDTFIIAGLQQYPDNELEIYNRWGNKVFSAQFYKNDWDGIAKGNNVFNKDEKLPAGPYFYVLNVGYNGVYKGWIYINY